ncbi:MAG: acyl-CoA thioesterase [Clostridia bacterium]|nr:acyl-CoA thioesterase [Clostridia bacterium]MBQ8573207.1 acyl-CoA thioesterase [Ruminococcus sp.]
MSSYLHKIKYYETDKMGVTHHSNYIRFMEEARTDFLINHGFDYAKLEEMGIISPVVSVECKYKATTTYPDEIEIFVKVSEVKAAKIRFEYIMKKADGSICIEAASEHCFITQDGKIARLKKDFPEFFEAMQKLAETE